MALWKPHPYTFDTQKENQPPSKWERHSHPLPQELWYHRSVLLWFFPQFYASARGLADLYFWTRDFLSKQKISVLLWSTHYHSIPSEEKQALHRIHERWASLGTWMADVIVGQEFAEEYGNIWDKWWCFILKWLASQPEPWELRWPHHTGWEGKYLCSNIWYIHLPLCEH